MQKKGNKYGTHRVIEPKGVLPQPEIMHCTTFAVKHYTGHKATTH